MDLALFAFQSADTRHTNSARVGNVVERIERGLAFIGVDNNGTAFQPCFLL